MRSLVRIALIVVGFYIGLVIGQPRQEEVRPTAYMIGEIRFSVQVSPEVAKQVKQILAEQNGF